MKATEIHIPWRLSYAVVYKALQYCYTKEIIEDEVTLKLEKVADLLIELKTITKKLIKNGSFIISILVLPHPQTASLYMSAFLCYISFDFKWI